MGTAVPLIACCLLIGGALVVRPDRVRAWLLLGALVVAGVILVGHVWDTDQVERLRDRPSLAVGATLAGIVVVAALAWVFARWPSAFPIAAVATLPFRIPITVGGSTANLLVPLYLVVTAGAVAYAARRLREAPAEVRPPGGLEWALAAALLAYAAQSWYSIDSDRALENVVFFYVPFAALFVLLARIRWTPQLVGRCLALLVALAVVLAGIGYVEYATRHIFLNPKVIASNQLEDYFRVNSLFFDPNIYGRFLAVVLILLVAWMLWRSRTRDVALGAAAAAFLMGGLLLTLSQSSFAALLAGLAVLAGLRWSAKWTLVVTGAAIVAAALAIGLGATAFDSSSSANEATSGRSDLIQGGIDLFGDRPIAGQGSGSFSREYRRAQHVSAERATSASHTIPVTVAAEQGVVGLAIYLALLWFALRRLLRRARGVAARAGIAAAFTAVVVHSLMYAAFLEDPLTWAVLGVGTALALLPEFAQDAEPA